MTTRRDFIATAGGCGALLSRQLGSLPVPVLARWKAAEGTIVASEPFGRLEAVAEGIWALISTPFTRDFTTVCNGGLVAGKNGVLAIEGFMQPAGATWLAERSRELTGRWPTHVLVSHYHSDHTAGVAGFFANEAKPRVYATTATTEQVQTRNKPADARRDAIFAEAIVVEPNGEQRIDLGGRSISLVARSGHTSSDVAAVVEELNVVFGGDLLWNGFFPNYMDTTPTVLAKSVESLKRPGDPFYVPGHGPISRAPEFDRFRAFLREIESVARRGHQQGTDTKTLAGTYKVPATLGEWALFDPSFLETAFKAWYRELGG